MRKNFPLRSTIFYYICQKLRCLPRYRLGLSLHHHANESLSPGRAHQNTTVSGQLFLLLRHGALKRRGRQDSLLLCLIGHRHIDEHLGIAFALPYQLGGLLAGAAEQIQEL